MRWEWRQSDPEPFSESLVAEFTGLSPDEAREGIAELVRYGVLMQVGEKDGVPCYLPGNARKIGGKWYVKAGRRNAPPQSVFGKRR